MSHDEPVYALDEEEAYPGDVSRRTARRTTLLAIIVALVAVGGFGVVVWYAYNQGIRQGSEAVAPVIRAPAEVKRKPDEPGGMDVPHQDKLVYDRLSPDEERPTLERLLPPPETPVARPEPEPQPTPEPAPAPQPEPAAAAPTPEVARAPDPEPELAAVAPTPPVPEPPVAEAPAPEPAPQVAVTPEPAAPAVPEPPAPKPEVASAPAAETPAPANGPSWRIQIASVRNEASARAEWERVQNKHRDLLGALDLTIQQVELEGRGTFFRIQGGPLADRAAATALCDKLKALKQDCLVARP